MMDDQMMVAAVEKEKWLKQPKVVNNILTKGAKHRWNWSCNAPGYEGKYAQYEDEVVPEITIKAGSPNNMTT